MTKYMHRILLLMLAFTLCIIQPSTHVAAATDEYDTLRDKWKTLLTGGTAVNTSDPDIVSRTTKLTTEVQMHWDTLIKSAGRTALWSDLTSTTDPSHITESYNRITEMARIYATPSSSLAGNTALRDDIINALDLLYDTRYNERTAEYGNWWYWEIGTPLALTNATVLMYNDLKARTDKDRVGLYMRAVNFYTPAVVDTGANRTWKATIVALSGVLTKNAAKLVDARDGLSPVFDYVSSRDGFYPDGSFIQHLTYSYTGGYGSQLLQQIGDLLYLLNGSTWQVTDSDKQNVAQWVYKSFEPLIYKGAFEDIARGRYISRPLEQDHVVGHGAIRAIIRLSQVAAASDAAVYKKMVKYWIQSDSYKSFFNDSSLNMITLAKAILNDLTITSRGELVTHRQFPQMDRIVHLRPGFGFSLSMFSPRIDNFESINGENLKGWYTSNGATYLYTGDASQYSDDYWATVNKLRLPGTTVDTQGRGNSTGAGGNNSNPWVGGAQLLGLYGSAGMDLNDVYNSLVAKKSWFMFDDEIVAVGSDITSTDNRAIETIIENRKLGCNADNALTVDNVANVKPNSVGWTEAMNNVRWIHLDGTGGYYFPTATAVRGLRESRTDTWASINSVYGANTPITRSYLSLALSHGANPTNATYSYVLLPSRTAAQVSNYAANPQVRIVEQSATAHAVEETNLHIFGANFWQDAPKTVGGYLTSDKRASVMTYESASSVEVAVSDPTQQNTGVINIEINRSATGLVSSDSAITVNQLSPTIKLTVNVNGAKGKSFRAKFSQSRAVAASVMSTTANLALPTPNCTYAADSFGRSVTGGWGRADVGGAYALTGGPASDFQVDGATGIMNLATAGSSRSAVLPDVSLLDTDLSVRVYGNKSSIGGAQYLYLVGRRVGNGAAEYRAQVRLVLGGAIGVQLFRYVGGTLTAIGSEAIVPNVTYASGKALRVRLQAVNTSPTTLRARLWEDGQTEPTTWLTSASDTTAILQAPGGVGLRTNISPQSTNAPVRFIFDDLRTINAPGYSNKVGTNNLNGIAAQDNAPDALTANGAIVDTSSPVTDEPLTQDIATTNTANANAAPLATTTAASAVTITSPTPTATLVASQAVHLSADLRYDNGGAPAGETYTWTSDRDGLLGTDQELTARLSPGAHILTFTVISPGAGSISANVQVNVQADTDADGLPDSYETAHPCLSAGTADASLDPDQDGLSSSDEWDNGVDPCVADTDHDGASDGDELRFGSNPLDAASLPPSERVTLSTVMADMGSCASRGTQAVDVQTSSPSTTWTVSANSDWIVATGGGTGSGKIQLHVNCQGLAVGAYTGTLVVQPANGIAREVQVRVISDYSIYLPLIRRP